MKIKEPVNKNYCAIVVKIKNIIPIENCENVVHTNIFGNLVVVSKDTKIGDQGLFFPVETKLSNDFLKYNNLYKKPELNIDQTKKGYFEENGRIRCVKFRGNKSEGFFIPSSSLNFCGKEFSQNNLLVGLEFDEINGIKICEKYIVVIKNMTSSTQSKGKKGLHRIKKISKLIDNQFNFHIDTNQLGKNIHHIKPNSIIQISVKQHGTSLISSKILCKRKLTLIEKILKFIGIKINDIEYDYIYSSRKVIKNQYKNTLKNGFYNEDIWGLAHNKIKHVLQDGMTIYAEIVGFLSNGNYIQKDFDYGCQPSEFDIYVYRITYTNLSGKVFEFSAKQIQDFCKENGIKAVPELYYGYASNLFKDKLIQNPLDENLEVWRNEFLELLKLTYLEGDEPMNKLKVVPREGIVLRIEKNYAEVYKLKSTKFLEHETKLLDSNEVDIESNN